VLREENPLNAHAGEVSMKLPIVCGQKGRERMDECCTCQAAFQPLNARSYSSHHILQLPRSIEGRLLFRESLNCLVSDGEENERVLPPHNRCVLLAEMPILIVSIIY
jgi:hypothetical protein